MDRNVPARGPKSRSARSLPHGSVDRNRFGVGHRHRQVVAPSRERGLKQISSDALSSYVDVAPSRERGSKPAKVLLASLRARRSLTGAWIETSRRSAACWLRLSLPHGSVDRNRAGSSCSASTACRSLTGAWIETGWCVFVAQRRGCRSLTGAWIETGLFGSTVDGWVRSLPHGSVDRNRSIPLRACPC